MIRSIVAALALVVIAYSSAHADGPIVARIGLGVTGYHDGPAPVQFGPGAQLDVGYRMDRLAAGVHFGITRHTHTFLDGNMEPEGDFEVDIIRMPFQLGVGAQWSMDWFWLAPWVGVGAHGRRADRALFAFGLAAAADVYRHPTGHRVAAYLEVSGGISEGEWENDIYSVGIAYRYW